MKPTDNPLTIYKRNPYWDIVRGIAILLVILGHSIVAAKGLEDPANVVICSFHIPLFMVVSGFFFNQSLQHPAKIIIWKRFFQLVVPILIIGTIDWTIGYFDISLSFKENCINWFARILRSLWFLQALFICSMIVLTGDRLLHQKAWPLFLIIFAFFLLTPDILQQAGTKSMFPFFVFGYFLNQQKQHLTPFVLKYKQFLLAASVLVFVLLLLFFRFKMTFYSSGGSLLNQDYSFFTILYFIIYRIFIGITGSIVVLLLVSFFPIHTRMAIFLAHLGKYTLWLYIISCYIWIGILTWFSGRIHSTYSASLLIFLITLFLSYPLAIICDCFWKHLEKKLRPKQ